MKYTPGNIIRALRLPFIAASVLPFVFGSFIPKGHFNWLGFLVGLCAVVVIHLGANLINDYADSKSGADWQDKNFYGFFGGSKLIQENIFLEKDYLVASLVCFLLAFSCVVCLAFILKSKLVIILSVIIVFLSLFYSKDPLKFSYHRLGEPVIFLLFGPVPVMVGYFIQTGIFPDLKSFILSLAFGLLTTAILFANEIPDFDSDKKSGKLTWVSISGPDKAYVIYFVLVLLAFLSIIFAVAVGYLRVSALASLILIVPAVKAMNIIRKNYPDKQRLLKSSKLTIDLQTFVGIILIIAVLV